MQQKKQMSESLVIAGILAIVGGFFDAYSYITRGFVFANAQTGNIVLLGINLANGKLGKVIDYLIPIGAFIVGILFTELIKSTFINYKKIHWRQIIIIIECIAVILVAFIPSNKNELANAIISFVCSLQVESFRKVNGNPYASTMCTGNLRSATEHLYRYSNNKDTHELYCSLEYFYVIFFFIAGAILGTVFTHIFDIVAVSFAIIPLLFILFLMNKSNRNE